MRFVKTPGSGRPVAKRGGRSVPAASPPRMGEATPSGPAARPDRGHVRPMSYAAVSLLVSVVLFLVFLAGDRGFLQVRRQRQQVAALQTEVSALAERNEALEKEVTRLKTDPAAVEKIARESLQLVAPGDVVLLLPEGWEKKVYPPARLSAPGPTATPTPEP